MKLSHILNERNSEEKENLFILLDTYQDGIYTFTGVSKTLKGIEKLKKEVISRFNITKPEELEHLQIFEVTLDEYFGMRAKLDYDIRNAEYEEPED